MSRDLGEAGTKFSILAGYDMTRWGMGESSKSLEESEIVVEHLDVGDFEAGMTSLLLLFVEVDK